MREIDGGYIMKNEFENILGMLSAANNAKLSEKMPDLMQFAGSEDGQKLKEKFSGSDEIKKAMENGDVGSLQCLLTTVLQTEEGKRLAKQLSDMLK
jgi:hypothetical protein